MIGPRTPAGDQFKRYDDIPAGADCTLTETADGHASAVSVVVEGSGQTVHVPAGGVVEADISDTYGLRPGQLEVTKTIAGPLAGQQGKVIIHTACNGAALTPEFVIPAGTPAERPVSHLLGYPHAGQLVVSETADGHTSTVPVVVMAARTPARSRPAEPGPHTSLTATARPRPLPAPPRLPPGHQDDRRSVRWPPGTSHDPRRLQRGRHVAELRDPRREAEGHRVAQFDGVPAGSVCTVTETRDGATAKVSATVAGNGQTVTVPAGKVVPVNLIDVYQGTPGFLKVAKTIAGRAARQHGRIAILVACGGPLNDFAFLIRAGTCRFCLALFRWPSGRIPLHRDRGAAATPARWPWSRSGSARG